MTFTPPDPHRIFDVLRIFLEDVRQLMAQHPDEERIAAAVAEVEAGVAQVESGLVKISAVFKR